MKADLAEATDTINDRQADRLLYAIERSLPAGSRVAIFGLSYKPDTAVIDESQGIALALKLLENGFQLVVSDPEAMPGLGSLLNERIERAGSAEEAIRDADAVAIMTPWATYRNIPPAWFGRGDQAKVWMLISWRRLFAIGWQSSKCQRRRLRQSRLAIRLRGRRMAPRLPPEPRS